LNGHNYRADGKSGHTSQNRIAKQITEGLRDHAQVTIDTRINDVHENSYFRAFDGVRQRLDLTLQSCITTPVWGYRTSISRINQYFGIHPKKS